MKSVQIVDRFFKKADDLRGVFDERFENPHHAHANRFVWDYWNVPNQYRAIRTPAYHYFPAKVYNDFHRQLVEWGRENLGCHDISPPWLSYYVDGCFQNPHADVPHGPWAFVYSLSPERPKYRGGETLLFNDRLLDYWSAGNLDQGHEWANWVEKIPAKFNRLTVFDPRIPHGVTKVENVDDPREARLVIHGWFVNPRPYVTGALKTSEVDSQLGDLVQGISSELSQISAFHGVISFRIPVSPAGRPGRVQWLTDTLRALDVKGLPPNAVRRIVETKVAGLRFRARAGRSQITVPLLFKS